MSTATVIMQKKETKSSLKDKIWNYLLENINILTPGIKTADGQYYPGNYRRQ